MDKHTRYINKQNKRVEALEVKDNGVISIDIDIPKCWKIYDLIVSCSLFVDSVDVNCGVILSLYMLKQEKESLLGSQMIGYNNFNNDVGFSGYHKEILDEQVGTGSLKFLLKCKVIDTLTETLSEATVMNSYIYVQGVRQH